MSVLEFVDGFDNYKTQAECQRKWSIAGNVTLEMPGRFSGYSVQFYNYTAYLQMILASSAKRTVGMAVQFSMGPLSSDPLIVLAFSDGVANTQVDLRYGVDTGQLYATRNGTLLGICSGLYTQNQWYYVEMQAVIHPTAGSVTVRVAEVEVLSLTGINTRSTANSTFSVVSVNYANPYHWTWYADDVYIVDASGTFLGECRVSTLFPSGDGTHIDFTPNSGTSHFSRVNESSPNDDTSYVSTQEVGAIDTYQFPAQSSGLIQAVQVNFCARKDNVGPRKLAVDYVDTHGTDHEITLPGDVPSNYVFLRTIMETDPATGSPWVVSDLNNSQFGPKLIL